MIRRRGMEGAEGAFRKGAALVGLGEPLSPCCLSLRALSP